MSVTIVSPFVTKSTYENDISNLRLDVNFLTTNVTQGKINEWNSAYSSRHTHSNKAILDLITQEKINHWDAGGGGGSSHTHANLEILNNITASYTIEDQSKLEGLSNYELTASKITTALSYTPMSNQHPSNSITDGKISEWDSAYSAMHGHTNYNVINGITSTLVNNWNTAFANNHTHDNKSTLDTITAQRMLGWDGKMDKVTENGNIVKVLGLDAENNAKNAEVVDVVGIWDSLTAPTEQELIDNYEGSLFVYAVALTPVMMYVKAGASWRKVTLSNI